MKSRIHIFGAVFGCVCAVAFSLAPFVAKADAGPSKVVAPAAKPVDANPKPTHTRRHMHRGDVSRKDDGCGD